MQIVSDNSTSNLVSNTVTKHMGKHKVYLLEIYPGGKDCTPFQGNHYFVYLDFSNVQSVNKNGEVDLPGETGAKSVIPA